MTFALYVVFVISMSKADSTVVVSCSCISLLRQENLYTQYLTKIILLKINIIKELTYKIPKIIGFQIHKMKNQT